MHPIDSYVDRPAKPSRLTATLLRLQHHVEANRSREQLAMERFGSWQAQWCEHRDLIAQQIEWLDRELSQLTLSTAAVPQLSLAIHTAADHAVESHDQSAVEAESDPPATDTTVAGVTLAGGAESKLSRSCGTIPGGTVSRGTLSTDTLSSEVGSSELATSDDGYSDNRQPAESQFDQAQHDEDDSELGIISLQGLPWGNPDRIRN